MSGFQNTKKFCLRRHAKCFVVSKIKDTAPWPYVISDLIGEPFTGSFYEKELQKTNKKKFRIEKVLKRKGDKLYDSFNSWINKKNLI